MTPHDITAFRERQGRDRYDGRAYIQPRRHQESREKQRGAKERLPCAGHALTTALSSLAVCAGHGVRQIACDACHLTNLVLR
jgi:hypothetical protein